MKTQHKGQSQKASKSYGNLFLKGSLSLILATFPFLSMACRSSEPPLADGNVTAEELAESPEQVDGMSVTIRGDVGQKISDGSFTIDQAGQEILVVNASGEPFILPSDGDYEVQATGESKNFVLAEVEEEFGLDLTPEIYVDFENQPAIIAQSLALAPEPGEVTENPERFYDLAIAVEGKVEEVLDLNSFTLDEEQLFGATDLLVINAPVTEEIEGDSVVVTGKLHKFVLAEFERDYDLTWDLDLKEQIEAEYTDKPVFVASALYPNP